MTDFFRKFPNLKKNDFYISGESYAGIYVPYLANEIINRNKLPTTETKINLKGILVGNACTDPRECYEPSSQGQDSMSIYQYQYLNNHAYITDDDYQRITGACTLGYTSAECKRLRGIQDKKFDQTLTVVNNIYQPCYHQKIPTGPVPRFLQSKLKGPNDYETCEDLKGILSFLNEPTLQNHLHVDYTKYDICSDPVADNYKMNSNASYWLYPILIKAGLRVWIYSGDVDANVPITGTLRWISLMKDVNGIPVVEPWREWWATGLHTHEDQMAGLVWKLRGFTFVSIKGAGHMVPSDKPKEAQIMLNAFINNEDLPYKS